MPLLPKAGSGGGGGAGGAYSFILASGETELGLELCLDVGPDWTLDGAARATPANASALGHRSNSRERYHL